MARLRARSPPRPAFLLRICETPVESVRRHYELHDLRDGAVHRFATLAALTRFLRAQQSPGIGDPGIDPAEGTAQSRAGAGDGGRTPACLRSASAAP